MLGFAHHTVKRRWLLTVCVCGWPATTFQVVAREAEAARLARRQQRKGVLCLAGMYSDVPLNLAGELLLLAQQPVAGRCVTHRWVERRAA